MAPSRRTVLVATATAGGVAAVAAGVGAWLASEAVRSADVLDEKLPKPARWLSLKQHLREHFHYLTLPDATLDAFVDAAKKRGRLPGSEKALGALHRQLLMSTDFLSTGADEARPVNFVAWYDPYSAPCVNPLAKLGTDDSPG